MIYRSLNLVSFGAEECLLDPYEASNVFLVNPLHLNKALCKGKKQGKETNLVKALLFVIKLHL